MDLPPFLDARAASEIQKRFGTPVYVYDQGSLEAQARSVLSFPNAYGLTARYAMKALPSAAVLRILTRAGLHIDASSGWEAERALRAGVSADRIQLTTQELPDNLGELVDQGVLVNACSVEQLRRFGRLYPGRSVTVRVNPGRGSGHSKRTNVGGPSASFGIWHEHLDQVQTVAVEYGLKVTGMHTHIGSGSDPEVWERCALMSLGIVAQLPDVTTLSLGGGYKVGRMAGEPSTDLSVIGTHIVEAFRAFAGDHGRELHLEVEPGTYLVANAGALVCTAIDVVDTGREGYRFVKVDAGMTEVLRPSLYGAQHPISCVPADDDGRGEFDYVVVGHCCESGDVLTPEPDNPEGLAPRRLTEARVGDAVVVGGAGAYCAGMSAKNYNSFPEAAEVLIASDGSMHLIRERQTLDQMIANERIPDLLR
jgi:diaminopimelate decarboxylase